MTMKILVIGASGFVGAQLTTDLLAAGHQVICCVRNTEYTQKLFPQCRIIDCDFIHDIDKTTWLDRLSGIDIVINTVGIFYHPSKKIIWRIHYAAPKALFDACKEKKIKKVIHLSALNVDEYDVEYAKSKKAVDEYLLSLNISAYILRPSLIYGRGSYGGTSLFRGLAALPYFIPLPQAGTQQLQPIHLTDLSRAILALIKIPAKNGVILSAVSRRKISIKNILYTLRNWLGFSKPIFLNIPNLFIKPAAWIGDLIPNSTINSTAYKMLMKNNTASKTDTQNFIDLIEFEPKIFKAGAFHEPSTVQDRWHARFYFLKPLLQLSLAFLWLFSAATSAFFYPQMVSYSLLTQTGISPSWQPFFLYGAIGLNTIIGCALLLNFQIKKLCILQFVVVLLYTLIITWKLPHLWLEPFGPITKNLPLILCFYILYVLEDSR
jgi:nucleoside-diphosphate-sugar epimerase